MATTDRADLVLFGVVRPDASGGVTDALAVRRGRVVALGRDRCTELGDAHLHPVMGGLNRLRCDLDDLHDLEDYRKRIADHARRPGDWLLGSGWYGDVFPGGFPTVGDLDALSGDRPAVLTSHDAHSVWVNTAALLRAGIDRRTPDPAGGRIHRSPDGRPSGLLMESAADLVTRLVPRPSTDELVEALAEAQRYLHSVGIVGWQDAAVGEMLGMPDLYPVYRAMQDSGRLTARVTGALWWDLERDESQIPELVRRRAESAHGERFRASAVKIMQDGVCENLTAAVMEGTRTSTGSASWSRSGSPRWRPRSPPSGWTCTCPPSAPEPSGSAWTRWRAATTRSKHDTRSPTSTSSPPTTCPGSLLSA